MKPNLLILNRAIRPPGDHWYQIEETGTYLMDDGRWMVIDNIALQAIVNRFYQDKQAAGNAWSGMLVDKDHLSHNLKNDTVAMAWLQEVQIRNDDRGNPQLWGRMDLTDIGETAVKNRRYKRFSTEYSECSLEDIGDRRVRPMRLTGLAFTNRSGNRGVFPIANRDGESALPGETNPRIATSKPPLKAIAEKLGLPSDANKSDILAAIDKLLGMIAADESKAFAILNRATEICSREGIPFNHAFNRVRAELT